jgi:glycosyltransferase involved in cell wall biosynthesis
MKIGYEAKRVFHNKTGLGNYSRDLIRILSVYFPEEEYLLFNPKKSKTSLFEVNNKNVFEKLPTSPFYKKFKNLWRQKGIVKDLKLNKITLFHGLSGELPVGLKKNNIKSVVTIHDLIFMRYPQLYSFFDRNVHFMKFKKAAQSADLVIAISEQTKKDIVTFLDVDAEKIKVIYQGCQSVFKQNYTEIEFKTITSKYKLPATFILNVGTIEERKNALLIVEAIKDLDTVLVLVGKETSYAEKIHHYIKEYHLEHKIIFLKGLSSKELALVYQLATVFVYPSIFEGFGIPIIEALFSKTPVITTKFGVFPEAGGPNTMYINPEDSKELQEKITLLLNDKSKRDEMIERGLEYAQRFNDELIAIELMQCYKELL